MISIILILFVALMLPGIIARTRARLSGRKGVTLYQHINHWETLLHKAPVYSPVTGLIFRVAPILSLAATLCAALLIPVGDFPALFSFEGDLVLFCYLLALGRILLILAAMDTGSSFEGMGASREALYGALVEPALFLVMGTMVLLSGQVGFAQIFSGTEALSPEMMVVMILLSYALFKIVLVESGRIPVDDPRTHLELTMIHEVMVLDYSGFDMALITLSSWIKTALLVVLAASSLTALLYWDSLVVVGVSLLLGVVIGGVESFLARSRMARNATYIVTILAVGILAFVIGYLLLNSVAI